ncbi:uncharacterized protein LOC134287664 [Aedes albopictus]|uniref:Secreted protein n=1 Tax=Aedes albopictus TaxID=7160 RepID=A0ABM1ZBF4_AEDAL
MYVGIPLFDKQELHREFTMCTTFSAKYKELFPWCAADNQDKKSAKCVWCNKSFKIDTMGKVAFSSHEKGKRHQQEANIRRTVVPVSSFAIASGSKAPLADNTSSAALDPIPYTSKTIKKDHVSTTGSTGLMNKYILSDKVTC